LSQPLTAILNNAHAIERMLNQQPVNLPELRNAIADIIEDDSRVRDVIRHLRCLLKKDSSGFGRVDMTLLIHKILGLVRRELALHRVKVVAKIAPDVPLVWGDDVQLQQLLLNLVTNAIEAIAASGMPGGLLTITAYKAPNAIFHLAISDTGNGLPSAAAESVFDAFYSTKEEGMGLGLWICNAIASGHKGTIEAENNSEGGATFHVTLPVAPQRPT
ncbi:MAG TPA: ATP-binding protein, partial [Rhizomicrobium sp.]|nr:ATP-binding protein [Rhizomicrobium sp.]